MHFNLRFLTEYRYAEPVTDNLNVLRVRPATNRTQRVEDYVVRVDPETRLGRHEDYFGSEVIEFGISRPHDHLTIDVRARVTTSDPGEPPEADWDAIRTPAYEQAGGEFLLADGDSSGDRRLDALAAQLDATTPLAVLRQLTQLIPDGFAYRQGVTYVDSTVIDLLDAGAGVCQDFVHLGLLLLRRHGIAARYVSGYLWSASDGQPSDEGREEAESIEVDTHAWLEALLPTTDGSGVPVWWGADPTNRRLAGESHVKIGHGRHYRDVPPIRGVYRGGAAAKLEASVRMTRLDPAASARA
jgi:transglutaminase-like putative cysteine protease